MWQKCPICEGTGIDKYTDKTCDTCGGMKIINSKTGMPPKLSDIKDFDEDEAFSYLRKTPKELQNKLIFHYWTDEYPKIQNKDEFDLEKYKYNGATISLEELLKGLENIKEYWSDGIIRESKK